MGRSIQLAWLVGWFCRKGPLTVAKCPVVQLHISGGAELETVTRSFGRNWEAGDQV